MPTEAHHIRFAQPRALGRKVSDEYTVPVGSLHHRELHDYGDEASWWAAVRFEVPTRRTTNATLRTRFGRRLAKRTPVPPPFSAMNNMPAASIGDRSFSTVDLNLGLFQIYLPS
jgi:hypothetical protein